MLDDTVSESTLRRLRQVSSATITTQLFKRGLRNTFLAGVTPLNPGGPRMVGAAFTLRYIPAREDIDVLSVFDDYDHPQRRAIETAPSGAVVVMDCRGQGRAASIGEILATRLRVRGVAGLVTDGAIRDSGGIRDLKLPVFTAGTSPTTNLAQHHAVDIQVPIGCAEVAVYPGDIMVGDADGVICVPRAMAADVALAAVRQEHLETYVLGLVEAGAPLRGTYPPDAATRRRYEIWAQSHPLLDPTEG
jgi:regulator of RNase E activity RraA